MCIRDRRGILLAMNHIKEIDIMLASCEKRSVSHIDIQRLLTFYTKFENTAGELWNCWLLQFCNTHITVSEETFKCVPRLFEIMKNEMEKIATLAKFAGCQLRIVNCTGTAGPARGKAETVRLSNFLS